MLALLALLVACSAPAAFRNGVNDPTACPEAQVTGCYHLDGTCWRVAPWAADPAACAAADACASGGSCTKWATCNTCEPAR